MAVQIAKSPEPQKIETAEISEVQSVGKKPDVPAEARPKTDFLSRLNNIKLFESKNVSLDDLVLFSQQLALLLETGNALVPAIGALAGQVESTALKTVLHKVHSQLEEGVSFSDCLRQHPQVFDSLFVSLIRAGEATGELTEGLNRIAGILQIKRGLRARIREAMAYPTVLLVIMTGTMIFLLSFVVPRFEGIFAGLGDELPFSTKMILGLTHLIRSRWWAIIPIISAAVLGFRWLLKRPLVIDILDRLKTGFPVVGPLFACGYLHQLFLSLGLLLGSRVPLLEAIGISREIVKNARYTAFFDRLTKYVEDGLGVSQAFREAPFLPETVKLMIFTGEESGALDVVMARLADHYQQELETNIKRLSVVLEPVMLVVMGGLVGFIATSFILPIFKMSRAIH